MRHFVSLHLHLDFIMDKKIVYYLIRNNLQYPKPVLEEQVKSEKTTKPPKEAKEIQRAVPIVHTTQSQPVSEAPSVPTKPVAEEDEMFGDVDEEDAAELERELKAAKAQAELAAKRAGKKKEVAKSTIVFDVKPVELETDMAELEKRVRSIEQDGLLWGTSKLVDVAFGIKKLVITLVVEDEKVSVDDVQEKIEAFDEFVQSTEIVAFNKI